MKLLCNGSLCPAELVAPDLGQALQAGFLDPEIYRSTTVKCTDLRKVLPADVVTVLVTV